MGPRPLSHGNLSPLRTVAWDQHRFELQWGRDLSVTETCLSTTVSIRPALRHSFNGAATSQSRKPSVCTAPPRTLRAHTCFNGAATSQSRKLQVSGLSGRRRQPCYRFNGAATSQSRKRLRMQPSWITSLARTSLQWGRDLSVTETRAISHDGPRSSARGFNGAATSQSRKPPSTFARARIVRAVPMLQWGRDLSVTETRQGVT